MGCVAPPAARRRSSPPITALPPRRDHIAATSGSGCAGKPVYPHRAVAPPWIRTGRRIMPLRLLGGDRSEQIVERLGEGGDALLDQRIGLAGQVEAKPVDLGQHAAGVVDILFERSARRVPRSRKAVHRRGGMVLTVSRPISVST